MVKRPAERSAAAAPATVRSEQAFRRGAVLAVALLLLAGTSPLFGHHLPLGIESALAGRDHIWAICLIALHAVLGPVHTAFHVLFAVGLLWAVADRVRAARSVHRALSLVAGAPPRSGGAVWRAARAAGVDPARVLVVPGLPTPAFTAGWLRPRIYVAASLQEHLSEAELAAVLAHEGAHVARRDPLRLSALRFLSCVLFWLPALRRLVEDVADEREILADDAAAERHGLALASALVRLGSWEPAPVASAVGFNGRDLLERRVLRLAGEDVPPRTRLTRGSVWGAAFALLLAWSSGAVVAHPLPCEDGAHGSGHGHDHGHATQCAVERRSTLSHVFCLSTWLGAAEHCPHREG